MVAAMVAVLTAAVVLSRLTGLSGYVGREEEDRLRARIDSFGSAASLIFIAVYVLAAVAFLPGAPLSLLSDLIFGPIFGTAWTVVGATAGATLAFLVGRYAARGAVASWAERSPRLRSLDRGVERHGWRMLLVTRLVPLLPFNLQNYAHGLTRVGLGTCVLPSALCIAPGSAAYAFAGGSLETVSELHS